MVNKMKCPDCGREFNSQSALNGHSISHNEEAIEKIRKSKLGKKNPNWKPKIERTCPICATKFRVLPSGRKYCKQECANKAASLRMRKNNPMFNPINTKKMVLTCRNNGVYDTGGVLGYLWREEKERMELAVHKSMTENNPMFNSDVVEKKRLTEESRYGKKFRVELMQEVRKSARNKPNKLELGFSEFIKENNLPFIYVSEKVWLNCLSGRKRTPDFAYSDGKTKKAILVGSKYWHQDNYHDTLIDYKGLGWDVLIIWDTEFYSNKESVLEKVTMFGEL